MSRPEPPRKRDLNYHHLLDYSEALGDALPEHHRQHAMSLAITAQFLLETALEEMQPDEL